ncbi:IclR family transcriptional regulator [Mesorhizobium sp.]|uniref:IclR family transcriptional regulator n=2 Tax=Mesorhizobium sp. TaxID=1871066 RepID=UPI000FE62EA3|nr:IclR family transcriptional regulator [Mesorhizobium sp.]RWK70721.1 MAG: IclR family transcriptional regulator [Mesorhizobium sp.]RWL04243.1 MAG: IclR family transcriptional regulator [Mesorhizobium sp.]
MKRKLLYLSTQINRRFTRRDKTSRLPCCTRRFGEEMKMTDQADTRYTVDSVDRAISLLQTVAGEADLGVSEIARRSGDSKARAFRLLQTLVRRGLLARSSDGKGYRLGLAALMLGHAASEQMDLIRLANPVLEELGQNIGETTQLRIRDDQESLCVAKWEPKRDLRVNAIVGRRRPLHAGSSKAFLAHMGDEEREVILSGPLKRFTKKTVTDPRLLRSGLEQIRKAKFFVSRGEINDDLISITAPVFVAPGKIIAALNIAAPENRVPEERISELGDMVARAAHRISAALGFRSPTPMI